MKKVSVVYAEKFKKGVILNSVGVDELIKMLKKKSVEVHLIEKGFMSDDSGFVSVKIVNYKSIKK